MELYKMEFVTLDGFQ